MTSPGSPDPGDTLTRQRERLLLARSLEDSDVPVVLITGCVGVTEAMVSGYRNVVTLVAKPVGLQQLLRVVDYAIFGSVDGLEATA